jgi:hypothetical protein
MIEGQIGWPPGQFNSTISNKKNSEYKVNDPAHIGGNHQKQTKSKPKAKGPQQQHEAVDRPPLEMLAVAEHRAKYSWRRRTYPMIYKRTTSSKSGELALPGGVPSAHAAFLLWDVRMPWACGLHFPSGRIVQQDLDGSVRRVIS